MHIIFLNMQDLQILLQLFLVSITLLFFFKCLLKPSINKNKNKPPSPRKLPILGNIHQLSSLAHHSLHALSSKHGPIILLHFGSYQTVIISSVEGAKEVMKTHDLIFASRPETRIYRRLLYDMKTTSVAPYGEYWRQLKSICVLQLLSNKRVQSFQSIRLEETENLMKRVHESSVLGSVDLSEMFTSLTNSVVCRAAFGKKYSEGESGRKLRKLFKEFLEVLGTICIGELIPMLSWINHIDGFNAKVDKVAKDVDEFLEGVVRERLDHQQLVDEGEHEEDFLDILIRVHKDNSTGFHLDIDSIKALLLDIVIAGTDTTGTLLEWTMSELLKHPEIMKRLKNEIKEVLNGKKDITDSDLVKMQYLKCVIKETLRLHPPIPLLVPRIARADTKIMGYDIGIGTWVMINAWTIGREVGYWDEPEEFKPERFLDSKVDFIGHDFQLIPFGAGRRGCPGISFAIATNEIVLANLVHRFDWNLPNGVEGEDLDMTERPSVTIARKFPLLTLAKPC
ncbi:hypothetical protein Leryth_019703 [Lithospermum erythrorhizon]|nr:hypothetical protein Leryth_019703 [Lithospermum erythrorhizon]